MSFWSIAKTDDGMSSDRIIRIKSSCFFMENLRLVRIHSSQITIKRFKFLDSFLPIRMTGQILEKLILVHKKGCRLSITVYTLWVDYSIFAGAAMHLSSFLSVDRLPLAMLRFQLLRLLQMFLS